MSRLLVTACLAAVLCVVSATITVTPSRPLATTTVKPSPSPSSTPTPSPNVPVDKDYVLKDNGKVCLHMTGAFVLEFTYAVGDKSKNDTKFVDFKNQTVQDQDSMCSISGLKAMLNITYMDYSLTFHISGNSTNNNWNVDETSIGFVFEKAEFPGYAGTVPPENAYVKVSSTKNNLVQDGGLKLSNQSYVCNANRSIGGFETIVQDHFGVVLSLKEFKVQAFHFQNTTSGAFNNPQGCPQDSAGNKVVPIAVGAALAGLVIVVLIAYLIGRLRNRKKSSYEALS